MSFVLRWQHDLCSYFSNYSATKKSDLNLLECIHDQCSGGMLIWRPHTSDHILLYGGYIGYINMYSRGGCRVDRIRQEVMRLYSVYIRMHKSNRINTTSYAVNFDYCSYIYSSCVEIFDKKCQINNIMLQAYFTITN